ncbi:MAG: serine/threonine-protein kinase [Candidatus Melainabacteria bacterium]|nr:serine/threonine-protein kinase [Candidatus Melainabacteria bacterium]
MDWPNPQDYNEAIQSPATCFSDASLRACQVETTAMGLPRPTSGAFTNVYKLIDSTGRGSAVRCFHSDVPDLKLRYLKVLEQLSKVDAQWSIKTEFIEQGIKVGGNWYPVVKMDWADGIPLDRYLAKNGTNQVRLNNLVQQLRAILSDMKHHGIAHGDLQHGNILIVDNQIKLVDYDGFFVPALDGLASAELGHANYQHPFRSREHFGPYIDNFPAWLITISLMAIAADPELLSYSKDRECLLFAHADLLAPYESALFSRLREHPKPEIQNATRTLIRLLDCPVKSIPFLDASEEELLELPEMDPTEQMQAIDEIALAEPNRYIERPPVLSALEKLSTTKRGAKDRLGYLFKSASTKGGAMLTSVLQQKRNSHDHATRGDSAFVTGDYAAAAEGYVKALAEIEKEKTAQEKLSKHDKTVHYRKQDTSGVDYNKYEDHLNLRLGTCQLLNLNPAAAVFHFKSVIKKYADDSGQLELLDAIVGLMMAYCQMQREHDAAELMAKTCSWKGQVNNKAPAFSANNLSCTLLSYGNGPLAGAPGLSMALTVVARFFEKAAQYDQAASLYEAARSVRGGAGSADDLDLMLRIGHCQLLNRRPDLALHHFHVISQTASVTDPIHDRSAVAQAVAFKMMNSRQDIVKAMRSRMPEQLYNCLKTELDGPLSDLDELSDVIVAFAAELGEADLMTGLRMATRLAADNYKRQDDKKLLDHIVELLNDGRFLDADKLANEDVLSNESVRLRFLDSAQLFARNLSTCGAYDQAFELLNKYSCDPRLVVEAMEGQIIKNIRAATRQINWTPDAFQEAFVILQALCANNALSEYICQFTADTIYGCTDRSDEFLVDVRQIADLMSKHHPDGPSNPHVLKLRMFALNAENGEPVPIIKRDSAPVSKLGAQFEKATRATSVSARSRQMENEVLSILRQASLKSWDPALFGEFLSTMEAMKKQRSLTVGFCQKLSTTLLDHFSESSGTNRWAKEAKTIPSERRAATKDTLNKLMDLFSSVAGIDAATLRRIQRCVEKV